MVIQIVEDDRGLREGIALALREPEIRFVQSGSVESAKSDFEHNPADLIILDINLPDGSGYDYLKWVRGRSQAPVLVLTENDMEMDEVTGLNLGADDYMTKPFSLAVLRARIQALLRRAGELEDTYEQEGFSFDFGQLIFRRDGRELSLSVNEQRLLKLLVDNRARIMTRSALTDRLWCDGGEYVDKNTLSVTVNRLRSKLEDGKTGVSYIQTIYGQGYMWKREG